MEGFIRATKFLSSLNVTFMKDGQRHNEGQTIGVQSADDVTEAVISLTFSTKTFGKRLMSIVVCVGTGGTEGDTILCMVTNTILG